MNPYQFISIWYVQRGTMYFKFQNITTLSSFHKMETILFDLIHWTKFAPSTDIWGFWYFCVRAENQTQFWSRNRTLWMIHIGGTSPFPWLKHSKHMKCLQFRQNWAEIYWKQYVSPCIEMFSRENKSLSLSLRVWISLCWHGCTGHCIAIWDPSTTKF